MVERTLLSTDIFRLHLLQNSLEEIFFLPVVNKRNVKFRPVKTGLLVFDVDCILFDSYSVSLWWTYAVTININLSIRRLSFKTNGVSYLRTSMAMSVSICTERSLAPCSEHIHYTSQDHVQEKFCSRVNFFGIINELSIGSRNVLSAPLITETAFWIGAITVNIPVHMGYR